MTDENVKFKVRKVYLIDGKRYEVLAIKRIKDTMCMVVEHLPNYLFYPVRYYLATIDEDDDSRATILLDDGVLKMYAKDEELKTYEEDE